MTDVQRLRTLARLQRLREQRHQAVVVSAAARLQASIDAETVAAEQEREAHTAHDELFAQPRLCLTSMSLSKAKLASSLEQHANARSAAAEARRDDHEARHALSRESTRTSLINRIARTEMRNQASKREMATLAEMRSLRAALAVEEELP